MSQAQRFIFPKIHPRDLGVLTARLHSEGVKVPDLKVPGGQRTIRLRHRQAALHAKHVLSQSAPVGMLTVVRLFDEPRLSRRSFDQTHQAELHKIRREPALAKQKPSKRRWPVDAPQDITAFAATVRMGRLAFDADQSARSRARRRQSSAA